ncbi:MAG: hypothetical protein DMG67_00905 [Acidobacteria bacterium]|nr:MAG: hypothetical protein DMG67_00905 [Acidobacteriota bacterium]
MLEAAGTGGISDRVAAVAEECKRQLGAQSVSIVCSAAAAVPFTAGAFRPIVVLPHSLLKTTSDDELRVAIGHELAHVYRHDYLLNILYELVSLPVAFHPCVLWMKRQIEKNRETACDEMAARCLESPTGYARALMSLARALPQPPVATMASSPALGVFDGNNLEERIMQLLDKTPRLSARAAGAVFAFSFLLLFATCVVGYSFALTPGQDASQSSAAGQPNLSGVWTGRLEEKLPDGRVGHGSLYLRLQQSGDQITGIVGDTQTTTSPVENVILSGSHLKFSAGAPGGPKGPVLWTLELNVKGDAMEGTGRAFRGTDNHSWDVEIKLTRNK